MSASKYAIGTKTPEFAHVAASVADVSAILRESDAIGRSVVVFGGGTLQGMGGVPSRYDVALDCSMLSRILVHEPRDLTLAAEAGCTLASLDQTLAAAGRFLPLDAPRAALATLGGTLASGWLGPRRAAYGRPRDFVIGTTGVLADGTVASAGGMVVKNVTGYDLSKLYVGSLGTLVALVRANVRTLPLPPARRLAIASLPEGTRSRAIARLAALAIEPTAALIVKGFTKTIDGTDGVDGRVLVLFEGTERTVDAATRDLRSALGSAGVPETRLLDREAGQVFARLLDAYVEPLGSRSVTYRSYGSPAQSAPRLDAFERVARANDLDVETIEDLRTGDVIARVSSRLTPDFAARAVTFDAQRRTVLSAARIVAAPERLRAKLDAWGAPPSALATMRAVKARFDPHGTLAPGRFVGSI